LEQQEDSGSWASFKKSLNSYIYLQSAPPDELVFAGNFVIELNDQETDSDDEWGFISLKSKG
jgi:hypothetical protein